MIGFELLRMQRGWLTAILLGLTLTLTAACSNDDDDDDDIVAPPNDDDDDTVNDDDVVDDDDTANDDDVTDDDDDVQPNDDDDVTDDDDDLPNLEDWEAETERLCDSLEKMDPITQEQLELFRRLCGEAVETHTTGAKCQSANNLKQLGIAIVNALPDLDIDQASERWAWAMRQRWHLSVEEELPDTCEGAARAGDLPQWDVGRITMAQIKGRVEFPEPFPNVETHEGVQYLHLALPGPSPQPPGGLPILPFTQKLVAVPQGAVPNLECTPGDPPGTTAIGLLLPAVQKVRDGIEPDEIDYAGDSENPPDFWSYRPAPPTPDPVVYGNGRPWPPNLCQFEIVGNYRGVDVGMLTIFSGQMNPDPSPAPDTVPTESLSLNYTKIEFDLKFVGGTDTFGPKNFGGPFGNHPGSPVDSFLNGEIVDDHLDLAQPPGPDGEELLILTPPLFREAADKYADFKNSQGIITNVFTVFDPLTPGLNTPEEVRAWIINRFETAKIAPWYLLIFGDSEFFPPFYVPDPEAPLQGNTLGTDFFYAQMNGPVSLETEWVADLSYGRLPIDEPENMMQVVDKLIAYQADPPEDPQGKFYNNAVMNAEFQCCRREPIYAPLYGTAQRTFIEVTEFGKRALETLGGKNVITNYDRSIDPGDNEVFPPIPVYNGNTDLYLYYAGNPSPMHLRPGQAPADIWDWKPAEEQTYLFNNNKPFLITFRGHGWASGWSEPAFTNSQIEYHLDDTEMLPVVLSPTCSTGLFDNETAPPQLGYQDFLEGMGEVWLRKPHGGAAAFIGGGRVTPSWPNTALFVGLIDAMYPGAAAGVGGLIPTRRMGDVLHRAKLTMWEYASVPAAMTPNDEAIFNTLVYHLFGDPTMEIWLKNPHQEPPLAKAPYVDPTPDPEEPGFDVLYPNDGAWITAWQKRSPDSPPIPVGRGKVENGMANIPWFADPLDGVGIHLIACIDDQPCVELGEYEPIPPCVPVPGGPPCP